MERADIAVISRNLLELIDHVKRVEMLAEQFTAPDETKAALVVARRYLKLALQDLQRRREVLEAIVRLGNARVSEGIAAD